MFHSRSKHIDTQYHWVHDVLEQKELDLQKVNTDDNGAHMLTKIVPMGKFEHCVKIVVMEAARLILLAGAARPAFSSFCWSRRSRRLVRGRLRNVVFDVGTDFSICPGQVSQPSFESAVLHRVFAAHSPHVRCPSCFCDELHSIAEHFDASANRWNQDCRSRGGYIVSDDSFGNKPNIILMGSGSELEIPMKAAYELRKEGKTVQVVSIVLWELFGKQPDDYKDSMLPKAVTTRVSIKAKTTFRWEKFVGTKETFVDSKEGWALGVKEKWVQIVGFRTI
ncbi:hypothetical protein KSP39_PZI010459 [Platanthera zijinensis]|uniref:Transketolase-like C-terminal domain-containing protein n=1 Tax=Platanthera zijinensis TaxID=2320716 RepID=A0AAP0G6I6_9ASPA